MYCILLIGIHTYYCNDKEQDCFSQLSYYSITERHVQLQKKSNIQKILTCATQLSPQACSHNATIKHYIMYTAEKFTKSMHPAAAVQ